MPQQATLDSSTVLFILLQRHKQNPLKIDIIAQGSDLILPGTWDYELKLEYLYFIDNLMSVLSLNVCVIVMK